MAYVSIHFSSFYVKSHLISFVLYENVLNGLKALHLSCKQMQVVMIGKM